MDMNNEKLSRGSNPSIDQLQRSALPSDVNARRMVARPEYMHNGLDKSPGNAKSIKGMLACSAVAAALLVLIALLAWISNSRFGQLLQALIR